MYQKPVIAVGSISKNGAIVRQILPHGVMLVFENSNNATLVTFTECEKIFL